MDYKREIVRLIQEVKEQKYLQYIYTLIKELLAA